MTALEIGRPRRGIGFNRNIIYVILIALFIAGIYFLAPKFEWHKPQIKVTPNTYFIGLAPIEIEINKQDSGFKSVSAKLSAGGTEIPPFPEPYQQPVLQNKHILAKSTKPGVKDR